MLHLQWQTTSGLGTLPEIGTFHGIVFVAAVDCERLLQSKERRRSIGTNTLC